MPFSKGTSGNPAGKAPGTRDRATRAAEQLLAGEAKQLTRKCIQMALAGDVQAMRLCMERIAPVRRGSAVRVPLPAINSASDVNTALSVITAAVSDGTLTTAEASELAALIEAARKSIELVQIEARLTALEQRHA